MTRQFLPQQLLAIVCIYAVRQSAAQDCIIAVAAAEFIEPFKLQETFFPISSNNTVNISATKCSAKMENFVIQANDGTCFEFFTKKMSFELPLCVFPTLPVFQLGCKSGGLPHVAELSVPGTELNFSSIISSEIAQIGCGKCGS